jgi:DNA-binding beta-propeller fold protein YncE
MRMLHTLLVVTCFSLLPAAASAVVVPGSLEFVEGGFDNCIPLSGCVDKDRYQQVFDSSEFSGPIWISEIRFRRDVGSAVPFSSSFSNVVIELSTTSAGPDALSTTFATNQGSDLTTVHSGALTLSSASSGGSPAPFDVSLVLTTAFLYDPSQGNLLLDWRNLGSENFLISFDAVNDTDSVSRLFADLPGDATGAADSVGLIAEFVELVADHPCCETGTPGCFDATIELAICAADPFCCSTSWDPVCVREVTTVAGGSCNACVARDTESASDAAIRACVCATDEFCCTTQWDNVCVTEVDSLACGSCAGQEFIYVNNNVSTTNSVSGFAVESGAGAPAGFLTPTFLSPYSTGDASGFIAHIGSIAATRDPACVFATNAVASTVTSFRRLAGGRLISPTSQSAGTSPVPVAVDEIQDLVFVGNFGSSDISVYGFDSLCALTPIGTYPVAPADTPLDLEVSSDGSKLFVSNDLSSQVSVFAIGAGGTSLTHVVGSPFAAGGFVHGLALAPDGSNVYACNEGDDTISGFDVGVAGGLTAVPGSPFATGDEPLGALVSNAGDYLIVANNGSGDLEVFGIAPNGSLSSVGSFATGSPSQGPAGLVTNASGQQIFTLNGGFDPAPAGTATISVHNLSGSGSLTTIFGSPFDTGVDSTPSGIVFVPEPGAVPMLTAGIATLLGLARRRRSRRAP